MAGPHAVRRAASKTAPPTSQSIQCGLWRTDAGFRSTIQIRNRWVIGRTTATPVLYMADGTEYDLPPVTILAGGVATVSVNDALASIPPSLAGHVSQFGSAAIQFSGNPTALGAQTVMGDLGLSLSYVAGFNGVATGAPAAQTLEGLVWARDSGIGGFVSLSNATAENRSVNIQSISASGQTQGTQSFVLTPHASQMVDLVGLAGHGFASEDSGGVRVQFTGRMGEVNVTAGLENAKEGYSATIPFWMSPPASSGVLGSSVTIGHPGIMIGAPDPSMGFPIGTRFTPYLALRNITGHSTSVSLTLYTEQGTSLQAPVQNLQAWESRQVDMSGVLQSLGLAGFNGALTLAVSHSGQVNDVISSAGSVDSSGTYVFEVDGRGVEQSLSKQTPYWTLKDGSNAMISFWNPTGTAEDVIATLNYAGGTGKYNFPVHLAPWATANLDILELVTDQSPDADGNRIPAGVQEGSLIFHSAAGMQKPMSLNVGVALFNVIKGTCTYTWVYCDGYNGVVITPASVTMAPMGSQELEAQGEYNDGTLITFQGSWSSGNTAVATVSNGSVTAVTAGTASISATVNLPVCGYYYGYNPSCLQLQTNENYTGNAIITVNDPTPTITQIMEITPVSQVITASTPFTVGTPTTITITGTGFGSPSCATLTFPDGITYSQGFCSDTSTTVTFTPDAPWTTGNDTLTLKCGGYNGQQFESGGGSQASTTATVSAASPPVPQIVGLQGLTSAGKYITPFAPATQTPQSPTNYMLIYGSNLSLSGGATTICVNGTCATAGATASVSGFHFTNPGPGQQTTPGQINVPYWVDSTGTSTGSYAVSVKTSAGTSPAGAAASFKIPYTEVTVIGWVCGSCVTLPSGENATLQSNLGTGSPTNNPLGCALDVSSWALGYPTSDLITAADKAYAVSFLVMNSGNSSPPSNLGSTPSSYEGGGNFRLFIDYGSPAGNYLALGITPDPCNTGVIPNWTEVAQASPYNNSTGLSATGLPYLLAEGRIGAVGQAVNGTLTGNSVPWIWSVIEFAKSGAPMYSNHSVFPTYSIYVNGVLQSTANQISPQTFATYTQTYQLVPPPNP